MRQKQKFARAVTNGWFGAGNGLAVLGNLALKADIHGSIEQRAHDQRVLGLSPADWGKRLPLRLHRHIRSMTIEGDNRDDRR